MVNIFGKIKNKKEKEGSVKIEPVVQEQEKDMPTSSTTKFLPTSHGILKGFYVSEKASVLNSLNQYTFKVFDSVTKNEVKKQVEKNFEVRVKSVKAINLPRKTRNVGRHTGFKPGLKKVIVVLREGYVIEQNKP